MNAKLNGSWIKTSVKITLSMFIGLLFFIPCSGQDHDRASAYFPLVEGATYTYKGVFQEKEFSKTIKVYTHEKDDGTKIYYFHNVDFETSINPILFNEMIASGVFIKNGDKVWILYAYSKMQLYKLDVTTKKRFLESPLIIDPKPKTIIDNSEMTVTYVIENYEDVQVPAGAFQRCVKIRLNTKTKYGNEYVEYAWLAKNIGLVKWQRDNGRIDELSEYSLKK